MLIRSWKMCVFKRLFIFCSKIQNLEVVIKSWKMRVLKRSPVFYNKTQHLETVPKRSFVLLQHKNKISKTASKQPFNFPTIKNKI